MPEDDVPTVLRVTQLGDDLWTAPHPEEDPEHRDVVFSGQLLGQMMAVAVAAAGNGDAEGDERGGKEIKSIHAVFARAGAYSAGPVAYRREAMHEGRAWASDTVTAYQGDRLLSRGLVLRNIVEPDLIRHAATMPEVPGPESCDRAEILVVFPGSEVRPVDPADALSPDGSPTSHHWVRLPVDLGGAAGARAALAWCQPGFTIGAAMQPHGEVARIGDSHRTVSTGVISHTSHFHEHVRPGEWLLVSSTASYAGNGRVYGSGTVFTQGGTLVSSFGQDAMVRRAEAPIDVRRGL